MTITLTPEMEHEIQAEAERHELTPEQVATRAMIAGLRGRHVPQTLSELKPRSVLPPGMTLKDAFEEFWRNHPSIETDEEVRLALDELS